MQKCKVTVEFDMETRANNADIVDFVMTAIKSEVGHVMLESQFSELDRDSVKVDVVFNKHLAKGKR